MTLILEQVFGSGVLAEERAVFRASGDVDIGVYAVLQTKVDGRGVTRAGNISHAFWFPDLTLKPHDFLVLYTKTGVRRTKVNDDYTTSHFLYWGLVEPLWVSGKAIVLLKNDSWQQLQAPTGWVRQPRRGLGLAQE